MTTNIEWTRGDDGSAGMTWNPVTGCAKVSPGCDNCYAERITERFHGKGSFAEVKLHHDRLDAPLRWRKPRRVFVNSMSDLFHDSVPSAFIAAVFDVMRQTPQHTYQILTKRPGRMRSLMRTAVPGEGWPLPNVWLGVSVEDQKRADLRVPALLETPAAVRFLSCEPLLSSVDLSRYLTPAPLGDKLWCPTARRQIDVIGSAACTCTGSHQIGQRLHWIIAGGESGPGARPMHPDWPRQLRDQCTAARVPFFFKQWGEWIPQPLYYTDKNHHVVMPNGHDRGIPWPGWKLDQPDAVVMERVGKKRAGRELDGRTWDEFPAKAVAV